MSFWRILHPMIISQGGGNQTIDAFSRSVLVLLKRREFNANLGRPKILYLQLITLPNTIRIASLWHFASGLYVMEYLSPSMSIFFP